MNDINNLFFDLIRVSIGVEACLSHTPRAAEWQELYAMAKKQSLVGICFAGVQSIRQAQEPERQRQCPPEALYLRWVGMAAKIQQCNEMVTRDVARVRRHFDEEGFNMVLLKGQGNLCNYSENLKALRTPGDIDAWVMPKGFAEMPVEERMKNDERFLKWLWKKDKGIRHCYIHVCYPFVEGADVEVHFRPSYINSPWRNKRFQRWLMEMAPEQIGNVVTLPHSDVKVAVPTAEFNVVYQLSHLYRHIFDDGLGLRQVLDYYFVLKSRNNNHENHDENENLLNAIREFGMLKFAGAMMYVLQKCLGSEKQYMICEPDSDAGEFLLQEIMQAGNFGQHDSRNKVAGKENGLQRLIRRQRRNMRFVRDYTEEVLSVPLYRLYQEFWRIRMTMKCK